MAPQPSQRILQLVAPVALYPDALLAEVLTAATYPEEVVAASRWVQEHAALQGEPREVAVDSQSWDASVKGLAQFPSVLDVMKRNSSWTAALADAYANEPDEVMSAIQVLRRRAQSAGTLQSTSEQTVATYDQTIVIDPAVPDFIYVPAYDPWLVYGAPMQAYPDWIDAAGVSYDGPYVTFGVGLDAGAFPTFDWGWQDWSFDWQRRSVLHRHAPYFSHEGAGARPHFDERAGMSIDNEPFERAGSPFEHGPFEHPESSALDAGDFAPHPFADGPHEGGFHAGGMEEGGFHGGGGGHR